jgi:hypothetical protein
MNLKYFVTCLLLLAFAYGCNNSRTEEENIQKLLESQTQLEQAQEKSVERLKEIKDSLDAQRVSLMDQRDSTDLLIRDMERNQTILANQLKQSEASEVSEEKSALEEQVTRYEDSISQLKEQLFTLNNELDSVERNITIYQIQEEQTEAYLESGISEIDQQMRQRENQKQQTLKRLDLLRKRVQVADKKMEAFELERKMYTDELDKLLRENASEEEKAQYRAKIAEMDTILTDQQALKEALQQEITSAQTFVAETDAFLNRMETEIKQEYDRKAIIEDFIASEKNRLEKELQSIQSTRQALLDEQTSIAADLAKTEAQIALLNRDLELIRNRKMNDLLEMQASIEQSEIFLAEEEMGLLRESRINPDRIVPSDTTNKELISLLDMGYQLDSLNELIQQEKAEIASTRKELAERRAEAIERRASFGRAVWITVVSLAIAGMALLALFYFLGRRSRVSRS